ncbi:MAG: redoxin domain-containing protein [Blastocatellia bacterium]
MKGIWLVSYFILWITVLFLVVAILVIARQIGLIHRRLNPASARIENAGPEIGTELIDFTAQDMAGRDIALASQEGKRYLLVFISAKCSACQQLMPAVKSIRKSERRHLEVLVVSLSEDENANRSFIERNDLGEITYIASRALGQKYNILAPPYAILVDEHRIVRSKGVVNHMEHLESLLETLKQGHPSIQSYVESKSKSEVESVFGAN